MTNFILHFTGSVITYRCFKLAVLVKGAPGVIFVLMTYFTSSTSANIWKDFSEVNDWWWCWCIYMYLNMEGRITFWRANIRYIWNKENIKAPRHCTLCGEFTGDRFNSLRKRPVTQKMFLFDGVIMTTHQQVFSSRGENFFTKCRIALKFVKRINNRRCCRFAREI